MHPLHRTTWYLTLLIYIIAVVVMPTTGHVYDLDCYARWTQLIMEKGLGRIYDGDTNYMPGHLMQMWLISFFIDARAEVASQMYQLKYLTFLADVAGALLLASLAPQKRIQLLLVALLLFNPAYLHNTVFWGQLDAVYSVLVFAAILAILRGKLLAGSLLYLMAFNFKIQAILFLPIIGILLLQKINFRSLTRSVVLKSIALHLVVQTLFLLPFLLMGRMGRFLLIFEQAGMAYSTVSLNASNFWYLVLQGNIRWVGDFNTFLGVSYKHWGLAMSLSLIFISLLPHLIRLVKQWRSKLKFNTDHTLSVLYTAAIGVLAFFYFNTQMHERYSYSAFLFIAAVSYLSRKWYLYVLFSLAYFLNNEQVLNFFKFDLYQWWLEPFFIAHIYLLLIGLLVMNLLMSYYRAEKRESAPKNTPAV